MVGNHIGHIKNVSDSEMLHDLFVGCVELVTQVQSFLQDFTRIVLGNQSIMECSLLIDLNSYGLGYNTEVLNLHMNGYLSANTLKPLTQTYISRMRSFLSVFTNSTAFLKANICTLLGDSFYIL